jgi:hypothetical protein
MLEYILDGGKFAKRWKGLVGENVYICLQGVGGLYEELRSTLPQKGEEFKEVRRYCRRAKRISADGIFIKNGAGLLDEALVNEPLRWLADSRYENVLVPFRMRLEHFLQGDKKPERLADAVTDMYESRPWLKIVTERPSSDLSANRELLSRSLDYQSPTRMLKKYIDYGSTFRHAGDGTKPKTWPASYEADAFVYLTGLFIRLAIQSEKK